MKHSLYNDVESLEKTLQREIQLARNIQMTLLNGKKPKIKGGEIAGASFPARLIGGDYYDFYPLLNGKVRIIIGDVMGKGIPAAMLMILTRGAFRSAAQSTEGPGKTLTAMNNALFQDLRALKSFVTVCCADWDPETNTLTYANAGHYPPLIVSDNEIKEPPAVPGIMLGGLPNQTYKEYTVEISNDDFVLFYTDGIIEAQNKEGEQFKKEQLIQTLLKKKYTKVEEIENSIVDSINTFTEGTPQKDDITMVILKVHQELVNIRSFNSPVINP